MKNELNGKDILDISALVLRVMAELVDRDQFKARFFELLDLDNPSEEDLTEINEAIDDLVESWIKDDMSEELDSRLKISDTIDQWIDNGVLDEQVEG